MYELIVLSLLARGPVHGYVISSVINDVIGPFARASNGRIYPLLTKLEADGLIEIDAETTSEGGRVARTFAITAAGRARFRDLMLDTTQNPREYRELFAFKVTAFDQITRDDRVILLEHYREFCAAHVRHLEHQGRDIERARTYRHSAAQRVRFASVFDHLVGGWQREAAWATALLAAEAAPKHRRRTAATSKP
jgi:DNA-binding PadR family transcriptional regulator